MSTRPTIQKLDETVVNRIAAGEVIQRPCNAVKELLENSLDAGSSTIHITLKGGGLKLLQIQDNGCGVRKDDMNIVCERFTTSKLTEFEDLSTISTFGFRGEALASISHVAHLTIITKTEDEPCAFKASYEDGKMKGQLKACAGNQGTQITAEDLFFNIPTRKRALKSPSEEHARVLDVVSRYAVHNPKVGFTLKKHGEGLVDLRTEPDSTHVDNIRTIYGNNIARELLEIDTKDEGLQLKITGHITNANYSTKKPIFLLFINNRLVDSSALRKSLDTIYSLYLPKGAHPFIYLSLFMNPRNLDVNVHPTKHEVNFLHEEAVIEKIKLEVSKILTGANSSRTFYTQVRLPTLPETIRDSEKTTVSANKLVRTDSSSQKIEKFFLKPSMKKPENAVSPSTKRRDPQLTSVSNLRQEIEQDVHVGLREILSNFTFVGHVDPATTLIQHDVNLYLCNTRNLSEEMFYQIMMYEFANFGVIKFKDNLPLQDLCMLGLECPEAGWKPDLGSKTQLSDDATSLLVSKADMLRDYFSMDIDQNGMLSTIPMLLVNYMPDLAGLPVFILRLATEVNWSDEQLCFQTFCRQTAKFYSQLSSTPQNIVPGNDDWEWTVEHVVYPTLKKSFLPPKKFSEDKTIVQIASLPNLYKVFERC